MVLEREDIFRKLKKGRPKLSGVRPTRMALTLEDGVLTLGLDDLALGIVRWEGEKSPNWNMQQDGAAFEAWALALRTWLGDSETPVEKVVLTRSGSAPMPEVGIVNRKTENYIDRETNTKWSSGHYMRFLYRLMRFSDACKDWFSIGDGEMARRVREFRDYYDNGHFVCNEPGREARDKNKAESMMEGYFERNPGPLGERLYRQLPVGVFEKEDRENKNHVKNCVFTGGSSALDLWSLSDKELTVYELKAGKKNKKMGIITELMFYCNLMCDVCVDKKIGFLAPEKSDKRGYDRLRGAKPDKVVGVMLTDALHPLISREVLDAMNDMSGGKIEYRAVHYDWDKESGTAAVREESF